MYLSLNWLKDFVAISKSITPEELGLRLTTHTVEIDGVEKQAEKFAGVVVGKILEVKKHPNADKLRLAQVDINSKKLGIVCGAPNIRAGQMVPVALLGAVLPNGLEIKEAEIRGEKSCGMLCAEDELGLGEDHAGIMILDNKAKIGQPLAEYLKLKDVVFEVDNKSITNRPDLWGHYGVAREMAAFLGIDLKKYNANTTNLHANTTNANMRINVKVEDFKLCPRYMAVGMDNIKIGPSPEWIEERLIAVGVRPINNVVDITNYVMLELGQPMHAFDAALININNANGGEFDKGECEIMVRRAKDGEVINTLDGEARELDNETLVIADKEKPVAIAGVMGGENSEISKETTSIIFEAANFDFLSVRKTAQKLGLRTESSMRFEKSLDPNLCETAIARAVELVKKSCPQARIISNIADEKKFSLNQEPIKLNLDWLNKFIGFEIEDKKIIEILEKLGFTIEKETEFPEGNSKLKANNAKKGGKQDNNEFSSGNSVSRPVLLVKVPSWRAAKDISIREDLAEEVARIYGYDNLEPVMPEVKMAAPEVNWERIIERKIKNILAGAPALAEVYNYSFVGEEQLKKLGINTSDYIRIANPIAEHYTVLRQSLVPNLFNNIKTNQPRFEQIGLFEIGNVFLPIEGENDKGGESGGNLPYQEKRLGIILAGRKAEDVFHKVKGIVEYLFNSFNLPAVFSDNETAPNWADKKMTARVNVDKIMLGSIFYLKKDIQQKIGVKKKTVAAEISLKELFNLILSHGDKKFQEFEKFPPAVRDLAFVVNQKILYNDIKDEILNFHEYIKSADLFDEYHGEKLGKGKKSLAFHIIYQTDKTLTAIEVDELQSGLIKKLEGRFEARVRDF